MSKFNLTDAASEVYKKAEEIYKNSEITADILTKVIDKFFSEEYSPNQLQTLKDFFIEQEEIFAEMEDADKKEEGYWEDREAGKCYKCRKVIPEGEMYIIDGQQYCLDCKGDIEQQLLDSNALEEEKNLNESSEQDSESDEIKIDGLTSYKNIATTFKNYSAFKANFGPIIIVKINKQYYVYKLDAVNSQDYKYQTDNADNIEGWLCGAVQANNGIFKDITTESKQVKTESSERYFIVGISNKTIRELIKTGEEYDKYVKSVIDDEANIFEYTDNIDQAERFGEKYDANYIAGKVKSVLGDKSVVVLVYEPKLEESLSANELLNNLTTIQTGIQKETGCFVTIDADNKGIRFTVKGNSEQLIKMLTWERELNKTLELFDYKVQKPIIREDNKYVYNLVQK